MTAKGFRTEISLKNFFIFNSTFHKEGDEEKKILFYFPLETSADIKVKDVGFTEAIIQFTNTFTKDDSCHSLHTQKSVQIYYQPEKNFWLVLTLNVAFETKKRENGAEYNDYKSDEIVDEVYKSLLSQSYNMFRLFMGTFEMHQKGSGDIENLRQKLNHFYSKYVLTITLQNSDILDVFKSIQYLPLNEILFLRIHNFIKMIESTFPVIAHSVFLYSHQVVWSGINLADLYSVNEYLVKTLFPKNLTAELQGGSIKKRYSFNSSHYGNFITGPESYDNCTKVPKMYILVGDELKEYYLIVYKALSGVLCMFVDAAVSPQLSDEFYQELHIFIGPRLASIASEICESFTSQTASQIQNLEIESGIGPKYLYLNDLNMQHGGTIQIDNFTKNTSLPREVMNLICDLYSSSSRVNDESPRDEEVVVKTLHNFWVVRKRSNSRNFFVIVNKSSTLLEVSDEAKKMYDTHMKHVYFDKHT